MSFLGGVFNSISKAVSPILTSALQAAAPVVGKGVTDLLSKVVGSAFDGIKGGIQNIAGNIPFIGPIVSKYAGLGLDALKGLSQGGIAKLIQGLVDKVAPQNVDGQQVTVPTVSTGNRNVAGVDIPAIQAQVATAAAAATAAPTASAPAGATGSSIDIATKALTAAKGNNSKEQALLDTIEDPKQKAMMQAQFDLAHLQEQTQFISTVAKMMHETSNTVIRNIA